MCGGSGRGFQSRCRVASRFGLFAMVMDRLTDEIRQETPWTMMLADVYSSAGRGHSRWRKT